MNFSDCWSNSYESLNLSQVQYFIFDIRFILARNVARLGAIRNSYTILVTRSNVMDTEELRIDLNKS
jgi:hypothetical protein